MVNITPIGYHRHYVMIAIVIFNLYLIFLIAILSPLTGAQRQDFIKVKRMKSYKIVVTFPIFVFLNDILETYRAYLFVYKYIVVHGKVKFSQRTTKELNGKKYKVARDLYRTFTCLSIKLLGFLSKKKILRWWLGIHSPSSFDSIM